VANAYRKNRGGRRKVTLVASKKIFSGLLEVSFIPSPGPSLFKKARICLGKSIAGTAKAVAGRAIAPISECWEQVNSGRLPV